MGIGWVTVVGNRMEFPAGVLNTTNFKTQAFNPF
jgi:hypothetical protein